MLFLSFVFKVNEKNQSAQKNEIKTNKNKKNKIHIKIRNIFFLITFFINCFEKLFQKIKIEFLYAKIKTAAGEAMGCAYNYGTIHFLISSISGFLPKNSTVKLCPDFLCDKPEIEFELILSIFIRQLLNIFFSAIIFIIKNYAKKLNFRK
jgi:hypothetical protein